jgi:Carboxypeptidase regulatory-like domain
MTPDDSYPGPVHGVPASRTPLGDEAGMRLASGPAGGISAGSGPAGLAWSVSGQVRLPDGRPVPGAAVTVTEPGTGRQAGATRTLPGGMFQVDLAAGGTYLMIVSAPGRRPAAEVITVDGLPLRRDVILAGSGVLAGTARITETGEAAAGVLVTLTDAQGQVVATGVTAADGTYRLDGLEAGDYTLVGMLSAKEPVARAVSVPGTEDLSFASPGYRVTALVTGPDGTPFAGAVVILAGPGGAVATGISDGQGLVAFEDIPADSYTLAAEGWGPGVTVARAEPGRVVRADIRLAPPSAGAEDEPGAWLLTETRFSPAAR